MRYILPLLLVLACPVRAGDVISRKAFPVAPTLNASALTLEEEASRNAWAEEAHRDSQAPLGYMKDYERAIGEMILIHGRYDAGLIEHYMGLASLHLEAGDYERARTGFRTCIHLTRVNHGLETLSQLPALEQLIASNTLLKNWEELGRNYHYLAWLYKRNFGHNDPRLLPALERLGRWQLRAYKMRLGGSGFAHLLEAEKTYKAALTILAAALPVEREAFASLLNALVLWNYYVAAHAAGDETLDGMTPPLPGGPDQRLSWLISEEASRQQMIEDHYKAGKYTLEQIAELYGKLGNVHDQAGALVQLGDWYLLFHKHATAQKYYRQAYALLLNAGPGGASAFFNRPYLLPAIDLLREDERKSRDRAPYVQVTLDINDRGRVSNVRLLQIGPQPDSLSRNQVVRALEILRHARFRPKYVAGDPADAQDFQLKLVFNEGKI